MSSPDTLVLQIETPSGKLIGFDGRFRLNLKLAFQKSPCPDPAEHLYPLCCFFRDIANLGVTFTFDVPIDDAKPLDLLVLFDCPARKRLPVLAKLSYARLLILDIENPLISPGNMAHFDDSCAISPYRLNAYKKVDTAYAYKQIPRVPSPREVNDIVNTSIICSNLLGDSSYLYAFRRHIINTFSALGPERFKFYGKGWQASLKRSLPQEVRKLYRNPGSLIKTLGYALISYPSVNLKCYLGSPPSKDVLLSISTSLCIENTVNVPGYTTEKALEPLIYGCLPIYVGPQSDSYLSGYLPVHRPDASRLLSEFRAVESLTSEEIADSAEKLRLSLNDGLHRGDIKTTFSAAYELIYSLA